MSTFKPSRFLRLTLVADALSSAALGLVCAAGAGVLSSFLGLPEALLRTVGIALLPWAVVVAFVATRDTLRPAYVWAIIALNVVWAIDSFGVLFSSSFQPTALGTAFVVLQAVVVLALAECELVGMRRARTLWVAPA